MPEASVVPYNLEGSAYGEKTMKSKLLSSAKWVFFISRRFASVDRKGRSRVTSFLSVLALTLGVMTLITVVSVMNGFQMSFIDSILELSSYHIQLRELPDNISDAINSSGTSTYSDFSAFAENNSQIKVAFPFLEAQGLFTSGNNRETSSIIRAIPSDILEKDPGFKKELKIIDGEFDLSEPENIVIGNYLAHILGVYVGSKINLSALSGGKDVELLSDSRFFTVKGIFESGYSDINQFYSFISLEGGQKYFGASSPVIYALKLKDYSHDSIILSQIRKSFPDSKSLSWREYNRSFFGALRIEKNILMMVVFLIFIVVAVNIYNAMRRLVFERKAEISTMYALGASPSEILSIFIFRGFITGLLGSLFGTVLALLITKNMHSVFMFTSHLMYYAEYIITSIFSPENAAYVRENPMYQIYAAIPARIFPSEVLFISFFGLVSPLFSSALASRSVLKMNVAEVLHDE